MSGVPLSGGPFPEADRLKSLVGKRFTIYETRVTPYSLVFLVNVNAATMEAQFNGLVRELWPIYYVPQIQLMHGEHVIEVVRRPKKKAYGLLINWILLLLTFVTTLFAGAFLWASYEGETGSGLNPGDLLWGGVFFSLPLLLILGVHELAHFLMARRHNVEASLPFFIPTPPPFVVFGTFGAFISLREPIPNRKALLDIGVSGPLAGFAVAIPVTLAGLFLSTSSKILPLTNCGPTFLSVPYGDLLLGPSFIWWLLSLFFPTASGNMNPLAIAGWVGILVTAINLLPAGQLDGGHVFRALMGKRSVWLSMTAVVVLLGLGFFYEGWLIFAILVLFLGVRHPPPLNDLTPLDSRRKALGIVAALILVGGVAIVPISSPQGSNYQPSVVHVSPYNSTMTNATISFQIVNKDIVSHAYSFTLNLTPQNLTNQTLKSYLSNLTWTTTYRSSLGSDTASGAGTFIMTLPEADANGGGSLVSIIFHIRDPIPAHFTFVLSGFEACAGVQHLTSSSGGHGGPWSLSHLSY